MKFRFSGKIEGLTILLLHFVLTQFEGHNERGETAVLLDFSQDGRG